MASVYESYTRDTRSRNRRSRFRFLAPVFGAGFSYRTRLELNFLAQKINVAESDVCDEFTAAAAIITAGVIAKGKLKRNKIINIISVTCI